MAQVSRHPGRLGLSGWSRLTRPIDAMDCPLCQRFHPVSRDPVRGWRKAGFYRM